jgi:tryptophan synthase alpha chain
MEMGVNRIDKLFREKKRAGKKSLIIYLTAGYPSLELTEKIIEAIEESGGDLLELGVPFSDPIADGPTIQRSSAHALEHGTSLAAILKLVGRVRKSVKMPIVLFSAYNPFQKYGLEKLVEEASRVGVDGFLSPDLPPEEAKEFKGLCKRNNLKLVFLIAPTTTAERKKLIARESSGFIYYIAAKGVTGARDTVSEDLGRQVREIKRYSDKPVAVGFGISKAEHVEMVADVADGVIVGSAIINLIGSKKGRLAIEGAVRRFIKKLKKPIK